MDSRTLIARAFDRCDPFPKEPVVRGDGVWVDLDAGGLRGDEPCVDQLFDHILIHETNQKYSISLFTGYPGSGKTTVLRDLADRLDNEKFRTVYVDVLDFLNVDVLIAPYEIYLSIAGQLDREMTSATDKAGRFFGAIRDFFESEISLDGVKLGLPDYAEFQLAIRNNISFRRELQKLVERRQQHEVLVRKCHEFIGEAMAALRKRNPDKRGVVVILDNLERLKDRDMPTLTETLRTIFVVQANLLALPLCHVVYTVPPWLNFEKVGASISGRHKHVTLPMCHTVLRGGKEHRAGVDMFLELFRRRFDQPDIALTDVFDSEAQSILRDLARLSGGYPRDFLRLVQGVLFRMFQKKDALPLAAERLNEYANRAVLDLADDYESGLREEDIEWLEIVEKENTIPASDAAVSRLVDWLDHHFVLHYRNSDAWYDIHPVIRERSRIYRDLKERRSRNEH